MVVINKIGKEIKAIEKQMLADRQRLAELRKQQEAEPVSDHTFYDVEGRPVSLSDMFGDGNELLLVHNMGKSCPYCTMWADEYNGVTHHLENRVPFVVISPDSPGVMKEFAASRNWKFKLYSSEGNSFSKDVGFENDNGKPLPGVSVFLKDEDGKVSHKTSSSFGPGDNYCSVWDYFDLLPAGSDGWHPKFGY